MGATLRKHLGIVIVVLGAGVTAAAQSSTVPATESQMYPITQDLLATKVFQDRVNDYVALHRLLEGLLPPLRTTTNMDEIRINMQMLTRRIVLARQHAAQGDIITAEVARMIRRRIATCLPPEEWAAILAELAEDEQGVPTPAVALRVNMPWPEHISFGFVPSQLLYALPPLPAELQYPHHRAFAGAVGSPCGSDCGLSAGRVYDLTPAASMQTLLAVRPVRRASRSDQSKTVADG